MAVHHMNKHNHKPNFWQNVGNKFKTAAHVAGTVKGVIDAGRTICRGIYSSALYCTNYSRTDLITFLIKYYINRWSK